MTPVTATTAMTAEEFFEWANRPENAESRYELEDGRVVEMPSPSELHGFCCWLAIKLLTEYTVRRGTGYLLTNDAGLVVKRKPDTVRGPDVMLFLEAPDPATMSRSFCQRVPALIVEVLSPSDTMRRTTTRVSQYLARGVKLVWVVDPDERVVYVHRPDEYVKILDETSELSGNGILPDFASPVRALFDPTPTP